MGDMERQQRNFVGYEYKELLTEDSRYSFLLDGYENFGWELDENLPENGEKWNLAAQQKKVLRLKRNRKIVNKMELTRLERNFEACVNEIDKLEKEKTSTATVYAIVLGVI